MYLNITGTPQGQRCQWPYSSAKNQKGAKGGVDNKVDGPGEDHSEEEGLEGRGDPGRQSGGDVPHALRDLLWCCQASPQPCQV